MAGTRNFLPLVVGVAALATGVIMSTMPASAQLHTNVGGFATRFGTDAMGDRLASSQTVVAADCSWQRRRVWDGYVWRSQRIRSCD